MAHRSILWVKVAGSVLAHGSGRFLFIYPVKLNIATMDLESEIKRLISVINEQKGELLFLQTLLVSIMRSMPPEFQSEVVERFDKAVEAARRAHLYSGASDEVIAAFDHYVKSLQNRAS